MNLYNYIHLQLDGTSRDLFSIGQNRTEPFVLPITRKDKQEMLVLQDEKQVDILITERLHG
jgi:hypothetical protein